MRRTSRIPLIWSTIMVALTLVQVSNVMAESNKESYQFVSSWDESFISPINIGDINHNSVAGSKGYIKVKDGKLYFDDGSEAKFWGVGLTFSEKSANPFPPEKKYAEGFAKKLAKYGINFVRFVGFDNTLPSIVRGWEKTGVIQSNYIDRLDYLIAKLRAQGIYYSFSINNTSMFLFDDMVDAPVNNYKQRWRKYRHLHLFYPPYYQRMVDWTKAFYSHKNKYTGFTYAEDPADIYVSAVNEDSIFKAYFENFRSLTHANVSLLYEQFSNYLKHIYGEQKNLEKAWCDTNLSVLDDINKSSVRVLMPEYLRYGCYKRKKDTVDFLASVDRNYAILIKEAMRTIGFKGLFTETNNYYGYGEMLSSQGVDTYTEIHGYFDHPVDKRITDKSFLKMLDDQGLAQDFAYPFIKSSIQARLGLPVIVGEWNHAAWSPYAYEGAMLMTAYASLQGYSGLIAHTWFSYPDTDFKSNTPTDAFAVGANPIFLSLSPSLSLAFIRGYIKESPDTHVLPLSSNMYEFYDLVLDAGLRKVLGVKKYSPSLLYKHKIRTIITSSNTEKLSDPVVHTDHRRSVRSDTDEILWDSNTKSGSKFVVNTSRFKALVSTNSSIERYNDVVVDMKRNGAVTVISLDNEPINTSKKILITAVSGLALDGDRTKFRINKVTGPLRLQRLEGEVQLYRSSRNKEKIAVYAIYPDGTSHQLDTHYVEGSSWASVKIGSNDTPWLLVKIDK